LGDPIIKKLPKEKKKQKQKKKKKKKERKKKKIIIIKKHPSLIWGSRIVWVQLPLVCEIGLNIPFLDDQMIEIDL
jgi:hypothetical protein